MKKNGLLKFMSIVELVFGGANLFSGCMSLFALVSQGDALLEAMQTQTGVSYTMQDMMFSVIQVLVGAVIMLGAGIVGLVFNGKQEKGKICLIAGFLLYAYIVIVDLIAIVVMKQATGITMIIPFLIHGLYLFGAWKNKQTVEA